MALNEVFYGSEIQVSIGKWDSTAETDGAWVYELVSYKEGFTYDVPESQEAVWDGLTYKGDKMIRAEKQLTITQRFRGFNEGLKAYEQMDGLLVKVEIVPDDGSTVEEETRYYTNFCTRKAQIDDIPNEGAFNISLAGRFAEELSESPDGSEDWVVDYSEDV